MKRVLSWGAFGLGIVLIIGGWFLWGDRTIVPNFVLNIVVSIIMYCLLFLDLLISWRKPEDKSDSRIGNTGLRWTVTFIYIVAAIVIMIVSSNKDLEFVTRLFWQGGALVLLIAGLALVMFSASNIKKVDTDQRVVRAGVDIMRRELKNLHYDTLDKGDVPQELVSRINTLIEEMRFVSPSNSEEAKDLENRFVELVGKARFMVSSYTFNAEAFAAEISKMERVFKDRKSTYSN